MLMQVSVTNFLFSLYCLETHRTKPVSVGVLCVHWSFSIITNTESFYYSSSKSGSHLFAT